MQRISLQNKFVASLTAGLFMAMLSPICFAGDANLNMVFTTTNAGGSYGSKHVHVVWITDQSGNFVFTAGSTITDNKRAVWANSRASSLKRWWGANPTNRTADVAARTGATQSSYQTYNLNWNWRRTDGTELPDGNYRIHFECTNSDSGTPSNYAYFDISKGGSAWRVPASGSTTTGGYSNIVLTFTAAAPTAPAVTTNAATSVTFNSATLNGNLTDNGRQDTTVKIYWGDNDGGATAASWDTVINLGVKAVGTFSSNVTGLTDNKTYYYRSFASNASGSTWASSTVSFTTPAAATSDINLQPSALLFANTAVGANSTLTFDIENRGQAALSVKAISLIGPDAGVFSLVSPPVVPFNMAGSGTLPYPKQTITVRFSPTSPKEYALAEVAVASNDKDEPAVYAKLRGSAIINPAVKLEDIGGIGSSANVVALYGADKLVVGQGAILNVLDISSPAAPQMKYSIPAGDVVEDIAVVGDTAYIAAGKTGIAAVSLLGPDPLKPATVYKTNGIAHSVSVEGTTLALANGPAGVRLYTITASGLQWTKTFKTDGPAVVVRIRGGLIYVLDEKTGLRIINPLIDLASGQVGWWKLDELSGGTASDSSGNNYNGTLYNGPVQLSGKIQNGLSFDGVNDYVQITGYKGITGGNARTCSAWVKTPGSAASNTVMLSWGGQQWIFGFFTTGHLTVYANGPYVKTTQVVADNQWHHVAAVLPNDGTPDAGEIKLYVDGQLKATVFSAGAINTASSNDVLLGTSMSGTSLAGYFKGMLDDVKLYNRALTASEIQGLVNNFGIEFGNSLMLNGNTAYITDQLNGLTVVDVASMPAQVGQMLLSGGAGKAVAVKDNWLYVAGSSGLELVNITNPALPVSGGIFASGAKAQDVVVSGNTAYLAQTTAGLNVLDVTAASNPASAAMFNLQSAAPAVLPLANLETVIVADNDTMKTIDLDMPYLPNTKGQLPSGINVLDAAFVGSTGFLACGVEGVKKVDLSTPASPVESGTFLPGGFADRVAAEGGMAAVGVGTKVYLVNTATMTETARWTAAGTILGLTVSGGYVFVAQGQQGLQILNASNGQPVGDTALTGTAYAVAVLGNYAYVACGENGLSIVDISTISQPDEKKVVGTSGIAEDVAAAGTKVCIAESGAGITVFDVSNPLNPAVYARKEMPVTGLRLDTADSRILLAGIRSGVVTLAPKTRPNTLYSDLNSDNAANLNDLNLLALKWLLNETLLEAIPENLNYFDTLVNHGDFMVLAGQWMQSAVALPQPVAYWAMDEISGSIVPDTTGAHHGQAFNISDASWGIGKKDGALTFDGVNDYVQITGYKGIAGGNARTCTAWVKTPGSAITNTVILSWGGSQWIYGFFTTGELIISANGPFARTTTVVADNQWHHVAAVVPNDGTPNTSEIKLYLDGQPATTFFVAGAINTVLSNDVLIGAFSNAGQPAGFFNGLLDDVRIYDSALTDSQVQKLSQ